MTEVTVLFLDATFSSTATGPKPLYLFQSQTVIFIPRVPERPTSARAWERSGDVHVPLVVEPAVYGQYGRYPG